MSESVQERLERVSATGVAGATFRLFEYSIDISAGADRVVSDAALKSFGEAVRVMSVAWLEALPRKGARYR